MDQIPSTGNNSNNDINQRFNMLNIKDYIIKTEHNPFFFDEPQADEPQADEPQADEPQADEPQADEPQEDEPVDVYDNMMGSSALTKQATAVLSSIEDEIVFVHEKYSSGDCDHDGPTEDFWTLYVVVVKDWVVTNLKFYREVYILQGDKDDDIAYDPEDLNQTDNDIFDNIHQQLYPSSIVVHNTDPSKLGKSAQATIAMVKAENSGNVFFTAEEETYGDIDRYGPAEYFWTLYVFIQKDDGTIVRRKFWREFHWMHDTCSMHDVPYEECEMDREDKKKQFHL